MMPSLLGYVTNNYGFICISKNPNNKLAGFLKQDALASVHQ